MVNKEMMKPVREWFPLVGGPCFQLNALALLVGGPEEGHPWKHVPAKVDKWKLEASTHTSANTTHVGPVFVIRDLDLWHFDPKINGFPGPVHLYVKLKVKHRFLRYQTHRQTGVKTIHTRLAKAQHAVQLTLTSQFTNNYTKVHL